MISADVGIGLIVSLPWVAAAALARRRWRGSPSLDDFGADPTHDAPLVSVIVPARDEKRNIAACVRSILSTTYEAVEVIVVDDHSTDGTGDLAREAGSGDPRLRVVAPPPLPEGWLGKQWACQSGAGEAGGSVLCFTDADTRHAPDLLPRAIRALRELHLAMLSLFGQQEMRSFWERVVQPHILVMLALRYGGPGEVNASRRAIDKIANGQFLLFARDAYERAGGHAAVRDRAAEDLALAQLLFGRGERTCLVLATRQFSTRMYTSLGELVTGWGKNIFTGGRETLPGPGLLRSVVAALLLPTGPLLVLLPFAALLTSAAGRGPVWLSVFGGASTLTVIGVFAAVYRRLDVPLGYLLTLPVGGLAVLAIVARAIALGRRITWKGRAYRIVDR